MAAIQSFGRYLPEAVLTNEELGLRLHVEPEWIRSASGISERRIATKDETVVVMAARAAEDCLLRADFDRAQLGLIMVASGSVSRPFPGPAGEVAQVMGLNGIPAIDVPMASAGALFALAMSADLTARFGWILVIAAERMSEAALSEPLNRDVAILFGDGAAAGLIGPDSRGLRICNHVLHSDGSFSENLKRDFQGSVTMDGRTVILQAGRKIPTVISEALTAAAVEPSAVSAFLLHQANQNLIDRVARTVGVSSDRFPSNIARYGNTSSASMLIAASEYFERHTAKSGEYFCFAAFGAGFHWGAVVTQAV